MRLRILSDLHLEIWPFELPKADADVVVLAGDIANGAAGIEWARSAFDAPVIYVPGNHEPYDLDYRSTQEAMRSAARETGVMLLDCDEAVIAGVRFLGCSLWTDYSLAPEAARPAVIEAARRFNPDYKVIQHGERKFAPEDAIALCNVHRAWLTEALRRPFEGRTVVVTHFAPHPGSIAPAYATHPANPGFVVDLSSLMGRSPLWIHGHTHTFFDYSVSGTLVVCKPRGYPKKATGLRADFVVEI